MLIQRFTVITAIIGVFTLTLTPHIQGAECNIPSDAQFENVSNPDRVVGNGTPGSCTSNAFVQAVAAGGVITFNCGPDPKTIYLNDTARVVAQQGLEVVIDGGNLITLNGRGNKRILYMNTCDTDQWRTEQCDNQSHPKLTVQNLTFVNGNSSGLRNPDGGGAIFVRGGQFKILHSNFMRNKCDNTGQDVGGAAVRVLDQYQNRPVYVVDSVFGGSAADANVCSNGGGLSSITVSYTVINSLFSHNRAIGIGGNPAEPGSPGGGSGAAIYNDGATYKLNVCGSSFHDNYARQFGGSIFFVSNPNTGTMKIENSGFWNNDQLRWLTHAGGISYKSDGHNPVFNSTYRTDGTAVPRYTTIDVDGDNKIGTAEVIHVLRTLSRGNNPEISRYARKYGDIDYNHRIDLTDAILGLQILAGEDPL